MLFRSYPCYSKSGRKPFFNLFSQAHAYAAAHGKRLARYRNAQVRIKEEAMPEWWLARQRLCFPPWR